MFANLLKRFSSLTLNKVGPFIRHTSFSSVKSHTASAIERLPLKFTPSLFVNITSEKPLVLDKPLSESKFIKDIPLSPNLSYIEHVDWNKIMEEPTKKIEQQAVTLIVIRRRKMKRHRLKILRLKMKFEWAKVRQRRELRKEKEFQAELMGKIKEAQKFNPALYAAEKIRKANEVPLPKLWKGKRLPEFLIKELRMESEKKYAKYLGRIERRQKMKTNVSDYNV